MPFKNCIVHTDITPEGTKVLRVTGRLVCQADRHELNKNADQLAPRKGAGGQTYIIDLLAVKAIAEPGLTALKFATNRFVSFGNRVAICAEKKLVIPEWYVILPFSVPVYHSFQEAVDSLNTKTEVTDGRRGD